MSSSVLGAVLGERDLNCIKQLLDEVEHGIMKLPKPSAEVDNTDTRF